MKYETIYNRIIEKDKSLESFVNTVRKIPPPQRGEIRRLKYLVAEGNQTARRRMIEMHLKVALKIALKRAETYDTDIRDTVSDACAGLLIAVDKYNPDSNGAFQSYASLWIWQSISLRQPTQRPLMYYAYHLKEMYFAAYPVLKENALSQNTTKEKRKKAEALLKKTFSFNRQQIQDIISATDRFESFEELTESSEELAPGAALPFSECFIDRCDDPENNALYNIFVEQIHSVIKTLSRRDQEILKKRFGFDGEQTLTFDTIGSQFNVSREWIRQIQAKIFINLRSKKTADQLKDFLELQSDLP